MYVHDYSYIYVYTYIKHTYICIYLCPPLMCTCNVYVMMPLMHTCVVACVCRRCGSARHVREGDALSS
jgi:hypothetical protein